MPPRSTYVLMYIYLKCCIRTTVLLLEYRDIVQYLMGLATPLASMSRLMYLYAYMLHVHSLCGI